jgi:hypothetical protein
VTSFSRRPSRAFPRARSLPYLWRRLPRQRRAPDLVDELVGGRMRRIEPAGGQRVINRTIDRAFLVSVRRFLDEHGGIIRRCCDRGPISLFCIRIKRDRTGSVFETRQRRSRLELCRGVGILLPLRGVGAGGFGGRIGGAPRSRRSRRGDVLGDGPIMRLAVALHRRFQCSLRVALAGEAADVTQHVGRGHTRDGRARRR